MVVVILFYYFFLFVNDLEMTNKSETAREINFLLIKVLIKIIFFEIFQKV